jgi:hypothetical protein
MKLKLMTFALFAAGLAAGLTLIAPAGADGTTGVYVSIDGTITAITDGSLTVNTLPCSRTASSPSLAGYKVGDHVAMGCANGAFAVLTDLRTAPLPSDAPATGARDAITALSTTSITVGSVTCSIGRTLPPLPFKVGDRVKLGCVGGVVIYVVADTETPAPTTTTTPVTTTTTTPTTSNATGARDPISALSTTSITVGPVTCSIGPSSPAVPFKVGDRVRMGCLNGVLVYVVADTDVPTTTTTTSTPPATTTTTTTTPVTPPPHDDLQTRLGTISAVGGGSITVDGLTCSLGPSSPSLDGYNVGDQVGIGCANGVLVKIGRPQVSGDDDFKVVVQLGSIVSIRGDGITVGSLSCKLADTSPSIASYQLGDRVGIGCAGGILFMIGKLPASDAAPKTEVKQALVDQFHGCIKRGAERCLVAGVLRRLTHKQ